MNEQLKNKIARAVRFIQSIPIGDDLQIAFSGGRIVLWFLTCATGQD